MNYFKTGLLMIALTLLMLLVGRSFGPGGMTIALIFALVMNVGMYWFSDKVVLAMYKAQPLTREAAPEVYRALDDLTRQANLPMPRVYLIDEWTPNAFATGRNPSHAVVAVTSGISQLLSYEEMKGVLAHELAHIRNRDMLIQTIASVAAGVITYLATMAKWAAIFGGFGGRDSDRGNNIIGLLATAILAPIAAMVIQMAISRSREYAADKAGAQFAGNSFGLASALEKLEQAANHAPMNAIPATAPLFIVNPLRGRSIYNLFSTHPPIQERIRRLREM